MNYTVNGSLTYTNAGTNVAGSLNIVSASAGTLTLNGGSNQFRSRAGVILQGNGAYTINSTNGTTFTGPAIEDDPFWVMGSGTLTLAVPFVRQHVACDRHRETRSRNAGDCGEFDCHRRDLSRPGHDRTRHGAALPSGGLSTAPGTAVVSNPGAGQLVWATQLRNNNGSTAAAAQSTAR